MPRKHTRFDICAVHQPHFATLTRARRAEMFAEGGPAYGPPCSTDDKGNPCRIFPGTDLFVPEVADGSELPLDWQVNR